MTILNKLLTRLRLVRQDDFDEVRMLLDVAESSLIKRNAHIAAQEIRINTLEESLNAARQSAREQAQQRKQTQGIVQAQEKTIRNLQFRLVSCNAGIQPTKNQSTTPKQANPNAHLRSNNAPKWQQKQTVVVTR